MVATENAVEPGMHVTNKTAYIPTYTRYQCQWVRASYNRPTLGTDLIFANLHTQPKISYPGRY